MRALASDSIDLVVTSPPYPMIRMWDDLFIRQDPAVAEALDGGDGMGAFDRMHSQLTPVWHEIFRILKPGGIACINIGDAVRSVKEAFALYPNQARILSDMLQIGFSPLPQILWRKQTNAPNKFMGSGMLPPHAYVTLEHEHIIVMRKGTTRKPVNLPAQKKIRHRSAYFWEERNHWFSDVWMELKGTRQKLHARKGRNRSAAFPFEVPYRLINMFSMQAYMVADPFMGTGTTMLAAMASGRNSTGFENEPDFKDALTAGILSVAKSANTKIDERLEAHLEFVNQRTVSGYEFKHWNRHYGFPVMTRQETDLLFNRPRHVEETENNSFQVDYDDSLQPEDGAVMRSPLPDTNNPKTKPTSQQFTQLMLFSGKKH